MARLFVGNLLYEIVEEDLKNLFSQIGEVVEVKIIRFKDSGKSRGFGFVEMFSEEEAKKAIEELDGKDYKGRKLVVSKARPKKQFPNSTASVKRSAL